jgi:crossover junction endodeoxyribonuclease RuvC
VRILGIDPGLERTGYGVVELTTAADASDAPAGGSRAGKSALAIGVPRLVEAGVIRTKPADALPDRLLEIESGLSSVIEEFRPDAMAVEQLYSHYAHPRTAILMGHARGVIYLAAARAGVEVASYAATHIKKSLTGSGHASKEQMQRAIQSRFNLKKPPEPPDVADALAAALCHAYRAARPTVRAKG